jgi:LEA14-like dessication related protein
MTLAPLFLAASLAAAPAHAEDPLDFELVGVEVESVGLRETRLELHTELERTRWPPVRLREIQYELSIGGDVVADGEADYEGAIWLRKGRPQPVGIPVSFRTLEAAGALGKDLMGGGRIDIRLEGTMRIRMLLIPFEIPIDTSLVDADLSF